MSEKNTIGTMGLLPGWTFKELPNGKFLAQQADGSGAVATDDSKDGIAQCILARLIRDILAQRAGTDGNAKDAARLDYFEKNFFCLVYHTQKGRWILLNSDSAKPNFEAGNVRSAIDAAMGGETK